VLATTLLAGCATESMKVLEVPQTAAAATRSTWTGARVSVSVGKFDNRSNYMRGVFSDAGDRVGGQAQTLLISHLQQTGRFAVMDRGNLSAIKQEAGWNAQASHIKGARFVISGDVTEFGRKTQGDQQLFGIVGRGKTQIAYSKVTLNVIDTQTSEVVFSASGAGEYALSHREVIGFGGTAGYDATLTGKVLDLSIREAVDRLVDGLHTSAWGM